MNDEMKGLLLDFEYELKDFLVPLLALDCLSQCERFPEFCVGNPEWLRQEYRSQMFSYVEQHAEQLSQAAVRIAARCCGRAQYIQVFREPAKP